MKIVTSLLSTTAALLAFSEVFAQEGMLRAIPAQERRLQILPPGWPYAFLINSEFDDNWCITAKNGVSNGRTVGYERCDILNTRGIRNLQLWLLDDIGKIRSFLDPLQCLYNEPKTGQINTGHSRVKFINCNALADHNLYKHNRVVDTVELRTSEDHCWKQVGNSIQNTDSVRAFNCVDRFSEKGFIFEYREFNCVVDSNSGGDVECCDSNDCGNNEFCIDYSCSGCNVNNPNVGCCTDSDCEFNEKCTADNQCQPNVAPPNLCEIADDRECCIFDRDCPSNDYTCISRTCLSDPFLLVNTIDGKDFCVADNNGGDYGDFREAGSEECRFVGTPTNQLWRRDPYNRYHSELNVRECITVGPGQTRGGRNVNIAPCKLNQFIYREITDQLELAQELAQEPKRCLKSHQNNEGGRISGDVCQREPAFEFIERDA